MLTTRKKRGVFLSLFGGPHHRIIRTRISSTFLVIFVSTLKEEPQRRDALCKLVSCFVSLTRVRADETRYQAIEDGTKRPHPRGSPGDVVTHIFFMDAAHLQWVVRDS